MERKRPAVVPEKPATTSNTVKLREREEEIFPGLVEKFNVFEERAVELFAFKKETQFFNCKV